MEQELDIKQKLTAWLTAPEEIVEDDALLLKDLTERYPYFQPLHLLLAKANLQSPEKNDSLATAALYTNGQLLHNLIHAPEDLVDMTFNVIPAADTVSSQPEPIEMDAIAEVLAETEGDLNLPADEQETFEEISEVDFKEFDPTNQQSKLEEGLVIENIVSADFFAFQENFTVETAIPELEKPVMVYQDVPEQMEAANQEEPVVISKYDDDKLPYTFLWWLAKTRKEHQQIFQPYASPKNMPSARQQKTGVPHQPGELQQQYVEHIFHMQSPFDAEEDATYPKEGLRPPTKGDEIIESFIKKDPQISPPKPEQIDNENKAKKSAEDHNDLVSETLAKIYIEQMLYDKAIETYEKLSLKFPEKSRYFADLIQSIEKKI
ncbi:hypothetical protein [Pedobacter africanus]|uniref:Tetratricopeptide repeat-containing protein n=1 Tax=Pedobacter africanus TaxID=151894 RepID=A0A1W2BIK0_9SPHI|nr:hypothetical protein [Pedobacter africanus]SMC72716.1 hypothetical protein SAMN04488524_2387 [Pedobacter africanus]